MRADERISQLERELAEERAKNARLQAELAMLQAKHTSLQTDDAQLCQQMEIEPYGRKNGVRFPGPEAMHASYGHPSRNS